LNQVQKGYHRDREIIRAVETHRALDANQIARLFFNDLKYGKRKAQDRLAKMAENKLLKRCRYAINESYVYYLDKKSGQIEHLVATNWVYVWMLGKLQTWETLYHWSYEVDLGIIRPDALCGIKNTVTGAVSWWFIELDRSENKFDKVAKYSKYYGDKLYQGQWWAKQAKAFPRVLVVTDSESRFKTIKGHIENENIHNLRIEVMLLHQIRGDAK